MTLQLPGLRERPADIAALIHQFVAELSAKHGVQPPKITRDAMAVLRSYGWPGNVRELRNVIELACLLRPGRPVRVADLAPALRAHAQKLGAPTAAPTGESIQVSLHEKLDEILHRVMLAALELEGGNRSRTARRLGISLRTVQRHLTQFPQE